MFTNCHTQDWYNIYMTSNTMCTNCQKTCPQTAANTSGSTYIWLNTQYTRPHYIVTNCNTQEWCNMYMIPYTTVTNCHKTCSRTATSSRMLEPHTIVTNCHETCSRTATHKSGDIYEWYRMQYARTATRHIHELLHAREVYVITHVPVTNCDTHQRTATRKSVNTHVRHRTR